MTNPFAANPMLLASAVMQGQQMGQARAAQQQAIAERARQSMIEGYKMQAMMRQEAARDGAEERQMIRQTFADEMATRKMLFSEMMQQANLGMRMEDRDYRRGRDSIMDERYEENLRLDGERFNEQMGIRRTEAEARLERERRLGASDVTSFQSFQDWFKDTTGVSSPDRSAIPQYNQAQNLFRHAQGIEQMDPRFGSYFTQDYRNRIQGNATNLAMQSAMGAEKLPMPKRDRPFSATTRSAIAAPENFMGGIALSQDGGIDPAAWGNRFLKEILTPIRLAEAGDLDSVRGVATNKAQYEASIDLAEQNKLIDPAAAAQARESLKRITVAPEASSDYGPSDALFVDPVDALLNM